MPRLVLHSVTLGDGRGPALRSVEAVIREGVVCAIAVPASHVGGSRTRTDLRQLDPHSSPRLFALVAAAVMRASGATTGAIR